MRAVAIVLLASVLLAGASVAGQSQWPQFLGPSRNGVYSGPLLTSWPAGGPKKVWEKRVGQGFAGPVVADNRLILFHRVGNEEVVDAFDARTGDPRWHFAYPTTYRDDFGFDEGPRSVPVVAGNRVYTFGAQGQLHALDLATGKRIWNVDTMQRFRVRKGFFGAAGSPLVEDGRVIANVGGVDGDKPAGIVAFAADTGAVLWTATNHEASYSSPVGATFGGKRVAVFFTRQGLVGLDPATGTVLFQRMWRSRTSASVNAATPLVIGDIIFISATYETGAAALKLQGNDLKELWSSDESLSNHYATSVYYNGYLFGYHGRQEFNPSFRAIELNTGTVKWSVDRFRAGTVTLAGDKLLILRETGELILAPASPQAFRPLAQAQILPPTARATPAIADGFLYARNEDTRGNDILACFDLRP
ncbi:MAG: alcohol dehydrogenase [Blastocatellia bacterium]|nr:MAG: alcohol dehydrogenase [Blastocatellia bacterium]